jgi:hypothetical protein
MKIKNKKAQMGSAIMWFYKILMLIFVIGGIIFIVSAHYSGKYDVREVEASVLSSKIIECFSDKGQINKEDFSRSNLDSCLVFDEKEIFINLTLQTSNQESISIGDENLKVYCEVKERGTEGKNLPQCFEQKYDIRIDESYGSLNVFIAILKLSKNT